MYELTIRIPDDFQVFFDGKTKFTRRAFVLNRRELQDEVRAFEMKERRVHQGEG